jgi:hypothetical protein
MIFFQEDTVVVSFLSHAIQILELSPPAMRHCGTASLQTDNTPSFIRCRTFLQAILFNSRMNRVIGTSSRTVVVPLRGDDGNRIEVISPGSRVGTLSVVLAHGRVPHVVRHLHPGTRAESLV